jgi:hypothetical protein
MRLILHEHPKARGLLRTLDRQKLAKVREDDELPLRRVGEVLGLKGDELSEFLDSGALNTTENDAGREIVLGSDLHKMARKLEAKEFVEAGDADAGQDGGARRRRPPPRRRAPPPWPWSTRRRPPRPRRMASASATRAGWRRRR